VLYVNVIVILIISPVLVAVLFKVVKELDVLITGIINDSDDSISDVDFDNPVLSKL
jgi:hypothetical protein